MSIAWPNTAPKEALGLRWLARRKNRPEPARSSVMADLARIAADPKFRWTDTAEDILSRNRRTFVRPKTRADDLRHAVGLVAFWTEYRSALANPKRHRPVASPETDPRLQLTIDLLRPTAHSTEDVIADAVRLDLLLRGYAPPLPTVQRPTSDTSLEDVCWANLTDNSLLSRLDKDEMVSPYKGRSNPYYLDDIVPPQESLPPPLSEKPKYIPPLPWLQVTTGTEDHAHYAGKPPATL